jgi:hypothetical protein
MSSITKAKVNLKERIIELEGSEAFVSKYLEFFQGQLTSFKQVSDDLPIANPEPKDNKGNGSNSVVSSEKQASKKRVLKPPASVAPIPIDLSAKNGNPSLKEFFHQKNPKNHMENLTVFAYFFKNYLNGTEMKLGHVVSCCQEVKKPSPTNIPSMFFNIQHLKGWLDVGAGSESAQITIKGENFVNYELPRKEDAKSD